VTEPRERAKNFGLVGAAFGIGFIIGPVLGGWVAGLTHNPASPFWLAGILGVINLLFITYFLSETNKNPLASRRFTLLKGVHNIRAAIRDVHARPVYLATFLYMSGFSFLTSFMGVLLVQRFSFDEAGIGTFFGVIGAWVVITQLFILRVIANKYGERQIVRYTMPIMGVTMLAYPFMPSPAALYATMPLLAVPQGLTMANLTSLVSKSVSAERQGAALGINGSLIALSQGIIPLLAGFGSGALGVRAPFIAGGFVIVCAWSVLLFFPRRH
jgi:DHA1 family tetracycline resistance protein-like MFS transporter